MAIQARKLDITVPMISHGSMVKQEFIDVGGDAVQGFICLTPYDPDFDKDDYQAFLADYRKTYPNYSPDSHTLALYDEMYMLKKAIEDNGPDREAINNFMRNVTDWDGILATYSVVNGEPNKPLFAVAVEGDKFTSYKPGK